MKKDTLGNISAASLSEAFKCGDCLHFNRVPHNNHQTVCSSKDKKNTNYVTAFAIAPKCFTPDVTQLATNNDQFVALAAIFNGYTTKQQRILLGMLRRSKSKRKLAFGTKVYFRAMGADYISNYLSGYCFGYSSAGELILSGNVEQNVRGKSYLAYMKDTDTLLTHKEWRIKAKELHDAGKIIDPASRIKIKVQPDYEPPTIDKSEWLDRRNNNRKQLRNRELVIDVSGR